MSIATCKKHATSSAPAAHDRHPCFNPEARRRFGRVHLPVAPACNISCNYCSRVFDCLNEGRPGVTSKILNPDEALLHLERAAGQCNISVAGIAGPGDPLANPENTFQTLELVRTRFPHMLLCLSTNGLAGPEYVKEMVDVKISHVTVTINALNAQTGAKIYKWIKLGKEIVIGPKAAAYLIERQLKTVRLLKKAGLTVKVNTVVIPGINELHVIKIAMAMRDMNVDLFNAIPLYPVAGTPFCGVPAPSASRMKWLKKLSGVYLPQMPHCARCRADAAGLLGEKGKLTDAVRSRSG